MTLEQLSDEARVWIYQADRDLSEEEVRKINERLSAFTAGWQAHGKPLHAAADVLMNRWVVIAADEEVHAASGCSIDASVAEMRALSSELGIDFFNRTLVGWMEEEELRVAPMHDFWARRKALLINDETTVFHNLAATLGELRAKTFIPFKESWHAEMWR